MFDDVNWALVEFIAIGVFLVLLFIRNELVHYVRVKAGNIIMTAPKDWRELMYVQALSTDYVFLVFDLRKWKFKHFFPWLEKYDEL